jgi:hypothetical protein
MSIDELRARSIAAIEALSERSIFGDAVDKNDTISKNDAMNSDVDAQFLREQFEHMSVQTDAAFVPAWSS